MTPSERSKIFRSKLAEHAPDALDYLIERATDPEQDAPTRIKINMEMTRLEAAFQMKETEAPPPPPSVKIVFDEVKKQAE